VTLGFPMLDSADFSVIETSRNGGEFEIRAHGHEAPTSRLAPSRCRAPVQGGGDLP
jgi:hypothetical protein